MDNIMIALQDIRKIYHIGSQDFAALALLYKLKKANLQHLWGLPDPVSLRL